MVIALKYVAGMRSIAQRLVAAVCAKLGYNNEMHIALVQVLPCSPALLTA